MTGSRPQWYNGILLLGSFFGCRLLWGTYQSLRVYQDCWAALHFSDTNLSPIAASLKVGGWNASMEIAHPKGIPELMDPTGGRGELMRFNPYPENMPLWLGLTYLGNNMLLNTLNFYWFGKMIETVKKRFRAPKDVRQPKEEGQVVDAVVEGVELDGRVVEKAADNEVEAGEAMNGGFETGKSSRLDNGGEMRRRRKS